MGLFQRRRGDMAGNGGQRAKTRQRFPVSQLGRRLQFVGEFGSAVDLKFQAYGGLKVHGFEPLPNELDPTEPQGDLICAQPEVGPAVLGVEQSRAPQTECGGSPLPGPAEGDRVGRRIGALERGVGIAPIKLVLSWPASAEGFALQSVASIGGVWENVTDAPVVEGDRLSVTVTVGAVGSRFYRLAKP